MKSIAKILLVLSFVVSLVGINQNSGVVAKAAYRRINRSYIRRTPRTVYRYRSYVRRTRRPVYRHYKTYIHRTYRTYKSSVRLGAPVPSSIGAKNGKLKSLVSLAKNKLGSPYVWGALGPNRFDCSGFTSYLFKKVLNKQLPRTADAQYHADKKVAQSQAKPGDLVFFSEGGGIGHVGLYVGNDVMIDAQNHGVISEHVHAPWWNLAGFARPVDNLN